MKIEIECLFLIPQILIQPFQAPMKPQNPRVEKAVLLGFPTFPPRSRSGFIIVKI